jgi:hypothetical protein
MRNLARACSSAALTRRRRTRRSLGYQYGRSGLSTLAQKLNLQGMVSAEITMRFDGAVKFVNALSGKPVLAQAVEDAVK